MFLKKKSQNLFKKPILNHLNKLNRVITKQETKEEPIVEEKKVMEVIEEQPQEVQQEKPVVTPTKKKYGATKKQENVVAE